MLHEIRNIVFYTAVTAWLFIVAGIVGCGGSSSTGPLSATPDQVDGGASTLKLAIELVDSSPSASVSKNSSETHDTVDAAGGTVTINNAKVAVESINLEMPDGRQCDDILFELDDCSCQPGASTDIVKNKSSDSSSTDGSSSSSDIDELRFAGPFVVDLILGTSNPSVESLVIPSGLYHEIKLKLAPLGAASPLVEVGNPLLGNTIVAEGTYTADAVNRLFRIVLNFDQEIKFSSDTGLTITEAKDVNTLILSFDINTWFEGINVGACLDSGAPVLDANNVAVISNDTAGDACNFESLLKDNMEKSSEASEVEDDMSS